MRSITSPYPPPRLPRWWRLRLQPFNDEGHMIETSVDGVQDDSGDWVARVTWSFDDGCEGEIPDVIAQTMTTLHNRAFIDVLCRVQPSPLWTALTDPGQMTHPDMEPVRGGLYERRGW